MRRLRAAVAGIASAGLLTFGAAPAEATALTIDGTMSIGCFGCGAYGPTGNGAYFRISGLLGPEIVVRAPGSMAFVIHGPGGVGGCLMSWVLEGEVHIDTPLQSIDSRVTIAFAGLTGFMSLHDLPSHGPVELVVTDPLGNPCGQAVEAKFSGVLGGV